MKIHPGGVVLFHVCRQQTEGQTGSRFPQFF